MSRQNDESNDVFKDIPVIGELPPSEAATKLRELGEIEAAEELEGITHLDIRMAVGLPRPTRPRAWNHISHSFGFIPKVNPDSAELIEVKHAGNMQADESLKNARIKITLDRFRVADYPGRGMHNVLFEFSAQNQTSGHKEHIHFSQLCRIQEGEHAPFIGYPIYTGLCIGTEGVVFQCQTVNVMNQEDKVLISIFESDALKAGLCLAATINPAVGVVSSFVIGITGFLLKRKGNVKVQEFYMGLDFSNVPARARLCEGSYIAVQVPESPQWDWSQWVYDCESGRITAREDRSQLIPYNYIVFSVSRYDGQ